MGGMVSPRRHRHRGDEEEFMVSCFSLLEVGVSLFLLDILWLRICRAIPFLFCEIAIQFAQTWLLIVDLYLRASVGLGSNL